MESRISRCAAAAPEKGAGCQDENRHRPTGGEPPIEHVINSVARDGGAKVACGICFCTSISGRLRCCILRCC